MGLGKIGQGRQRLGLEREYGWIFGGLGIELGLVWSSGKAIGIDIEIKLRFYRIRNYRCEGSMVTVVTCALLVTVLFPLS